MEEYLNITPGSLSLMGLIFDKEKKVHLVIDKKSWMRIFRMPSVYQYFHSVDEDQ